MAVSKIRDFKCLNEHRVSTCDCSNGKNLFFDVMCFTSVGFPFVYFRYEKIGICDDVRARYIIYGLRS